MTPTSKTTGDPATYQVLKWLLSGADEQQIREALADQFPKANADRCLAAVMSHFEAIAEADRSVIRGWCLEAFRDLYQRSLAIGDFGTALKAIKELSRLSK